MPTKTTKSTEPIILKLRKVGNSFGFILPRSVVRNMNIREGDAFEVKKNGDNIQLMPADSNFLKWEKIEEKVSAQYRNTLKLLAEGKSDDAEAG